MMNIYHWFKWVNKGYVKKINIWCIKWVFLSLDYGINDLLVCVCKGAMVKHRKWDQHNGYYHSKLDQ